MNKRPDHYCKECGKHLGWDHDKSREELPFRCLGSLVDGKWVCKNPYRG